MKCLAIDDEPLALAQLSDYISRVPFLSLVKPCQDAFEAMKVLSDEDVDLIFVDINMPDLNGLDFIRSLISPPLVIFTTAYSEYAVDGFKLDAVDYLLKPFEFQDLLKAADKARKQFEYKLLEQQSELGNASQVKGDSLFVKSDCRVVRIDINNIRYIEGMSEYVRIFVEGENKHLSLRRQRQMCIRDRYRRYERIRPYFCGGGEQACHHTCQSSENGRTASRTFHACASFLYCQLA